MTSVNITCGRNIHYNNSFPSNKFQKVFNCVVHEDFNYLRLTVIPDKTKSSELYVNV